MDNGKIARTLGRVLTSARSGDVSQLRAKADQARDSGRWAEAAELYRRYLKQHGGDVAIWVQVGNCSKEAGDFEEALTAYDTAIELNGQSADAYLQRGHLLKVMGRTTQAVESFQRSLEITPKRNPATQELIGLGAAQVIDPGPHDAREPASLTIYIDVTDLLDYLRVNLSLSGIQRVVANLIEFADDFQKGERGCAIRPVLPDYNDPNVYTIRMGLLQALIESVAVRSSREIIDRALEALRASRSRVTLTASDTLLVPGAFWIYQRYDLFSRLRQDGVRVTVFIHDLIQITNPEFVEPAATTVFRRSFVDILNVSSYLLSNSRYVAKDIDTYLTQRMNFRIPVQPVTLATELGTSQLNYDIVSGDIRDVTQDDFVLYVSTIEVRKNHLYLIKIWERLIADGAPWIPNLVFVGKWGWEIDDLRKHLAASDYLGGRLFIFNGISDTELAVLYQHCKLTVYPSYAEGWGLPVGESLGYGKPCVASKVTSIPEVGGDFCRYIDPFDWEDGHRVIAEVLADRPGLAAWTAAVQSGFKPKTWRTFAHELFTVVQRFGQDPTLDAPGNNCIVETGEIVAFGNDAIAQLDARLGKLVSARMTRIKGWHGIESWGCWAAKRRAELRFRTRLEPGADILLYLNLRTPEGDLFAGCTIQSGAHSTVVDDLGPTPRWCTARGQVAERGEVRIALVSGRGFQHLHGRELFVGIVALAVSPLHSRADREKILEAIVPGGLLMGQTS